LHGLRSIFTKDRPIRRPDEAYATGNADLDRIVEPYVDVNHPGVRICWAPSAGTLPQFRSATTV